MLNNSASFIPYPSTTPERAKAPVLLTFIIVVNRHCLWFYIQKNIPSRRPLTHICAATVLMRPKFINFFRIRRPANLFYVRGFRTAFTAFEQNGTYNNIPSNSGSRNYQAFIRGKNRPSFKNPLFPRRLSLYAYFPVL